MERLALIILILIANLQIVALREHAPKNVTFDLKLNQIRCENGKFRNGRGECEAYASCKTIKNVKKDRRITSKLGNAKKSFIGRYAGIKVVYSVPNSKFWYKNFKQGINIVRQLQGSDQIIRLVGYCDDVRNLQVSVDFFTLSKL